jgi:diguanylate cyclase (GGDEF)-like protein
MGQSRVDPRSSVRFILSLSGIERRELMMATAHEEPGAVRTAASNGRDGAMPWSTLPGNTRIYVGGVTALGASAIVAALPDAAAGHPVLLGMLLLLSVGTATAKVTLPVSPAGSTLTICYVVDFLTLLLLGPAAATVVAAAGAGAQCMFKPKARAAAYQTAFSVSAVALTAATAGWIFVGLGGEPGLVGVDLHLEAIAVAAAAFFLVNSLLIARAVALTAGLATLDVWRRHYLWSWPGHLLGFSLAVGGAASFERSALWLIPLAVASLVMTFENFRAYVTRLTESVTDPLTDLPNLRYLHQHGAQELARAWRTGTPLAILLIDVDAFKSINDTYGHHAGDVALRHVGACLQTALRTYDICARTGGDEFVGVLPGCSLESAQRKAAALETAVTLVTFEPRAGVKAPLRISVGIAMFPADGDSLQQLLKAADTRMFENKHAHEERFATARAALPAVNEEALSAIQREDRDLRQRLMQAQRLEAIGQLAGGVAHDFNNVLTAIMGYSELLTEQIGPDKPIGRDLQEILGAAKHAAALTHQLLTFSRRQDRAATLVDLNSVVNESESLLRRLLGERIAITTQLAPDLAAIMADATQLEQIVINLAVNARDAMPRGGGITIGTQNLNLDNGLSYVELVVQDAGSGIPPEVLPKIFEPFFTTKGPGKGTGLGLAAIDSIVKEMDGRISVDSELGRGTTFRIRLPSTADRTAGAHHTDPRPEIPVGGETILWVEDEPAVRQFAAVALTRHGYHVFEADSAESAVRLMESGRERIDLLLTDVILPGMDGWELAHRWQVRNPRARTLFTTGYVVGDGNGSTARRVDLLEKPFTAQALLTKIREVLDGCHPAPAPNARLAYAIPAAKSSF